MKNRVNCSRYGDVAVSDRRMRSQNGIRPSRSLSLRSGTAISGTFAMALAGLVAAAPDQAKSQQTLYWAGGQAIGNGDPIAPLGGTWSTSIQNWTSDPTNNSPAVAWTNTHGMSAIFSPPGANLLDVVEVDGTISFDTLALTAGLSNPVTRITGSGTLQFNTAAGKSYATISSGGSSNSYMVISALMANGTDANNAVVQDLHLTNGGSGNGNFVFYGDQQYTGTTTVGDNVGLALGIFPLTSQFEGGNGSVMGDIVLGQNSLLIVTAWEADRNFNNNIAGGSTSVLYFVSGSSGNANFYTIYLDVDLPQFSGETYVDQTATLDGDGSTAGKLTVGGTLVGVAGQTDLAFDSLEMSSASTMNLTLTAANAGTAPFAFTGDMDIADGLLVATVDADEQIYTIATYGGTLNYNATDYFSAAPTITGTSNRYALYHVDPVAMGPSGTLLLVVYDANDQLHEYWNGGASSPAANTLVGGTGTWNAASQVWKISPTATGAYSWVGSIAVFAGTTGGTVTLDGDQSFEEIQFTQQEYEIVGSDNLVMSPYTGTSGTISVSTTKATIAADIANGENSANGGVSDLEKTGAGTLVLVGVKSFSGTTTISEGIVQLGDGTSNGGVSGDIAISSGGLALNAAASGPTMTFSNALTGASGTSLTINSGTVDFQTAGLSSFTGKTAVAGGTLQLSGSVGGDVEVQNGGTLSGIGTIGGGLKVDQNGTLSGDDTATGPLTVTGMLTLDTGALLDLSYSTPSAPGSPTVLFVSDGYDIQGTVTVTLNSTSLANGNYYLLDYQDPSKRTGNPATLLVISGSPANYRFVDDGVRYIYLRVGPGGPGGELYWHPNQTTAGNFGGQGTWAAIGSNINWTDSSGTPNKTWVSQASAVFKGAAATVTVDSSTAINVAGMRFEVDGYALTGGGAVLSLDGSSNPVAIEVTNSGQTATIDVALGEMPGTPALMSKTGDGTLILTEVNTYTGGTAVSAGTLQLGDGTKDGTLSATGSVAISGGATLSVLPSAAYTFASVLTGADSTANFEIRGTGPLSFQSASSAFAGATTVFSGAVLTGNGNGSLGGTVTINDGGTLSGQQITTPSALSVLTMDNLVLSADAGDGGSVIAATFSTPAATGPGLFAVDNVTLNGVLQANDVSSNPLAEGTYILIQSANLPTGTIADLKIDRANSSFAAAPILSITASNNVVLTVGNSTNPGDASAYSYWNGVNTGPTSGPQGGLGTWTAVATNWTNSTGTTPGAFTPLTYAYFTNTGGTVTVDGTNGAITDVYGLIFNVDGYTITGDPLTLASNYSDNLAEINVNNAAAATIESDLRGAGVGVIKTGAGTAIFSGTKSYALDTVVQTGTLQLGVSGGTLPTLAGDVTIDDNATLTLFTNNTETVNFANTLHGTSNATMNINGTGVVRIAGASQTTFDGFTFVNAGATLRSSSSTASLGGDITIRSQGILSGSSADATLSLGANVSGNLTFVAQDSVLVASLNMVPSSNPLFATTTLSALSGMTIEVIQIDGSLQPGSRYPLISYVGISHVSLGDIVFSPADPHYSVLLDSQILYLSYNTPGDSYWNPAQGTDAPDYGGGGTWTASTGNGWSDAPPASYHGTWTQGSTAIMESQPGTITVDSSSVINVGGFNISQNYDFEGGATETLTLDANGGTTPVEFNIDGAGITVNLDVTLAEADPGTGLSKTGSGTLVIKQAVSYTGTTSVTAGKLQLSDSGAIGEAIDISDGGTFSINIAGTMTLGASNVLSRTLVANQPVAAFNIDAGTVELNNDSSGYSGDTNVAGTLTGTGKLGGTATIQSGGTLAGAAGSLMTFTDTLELARGATLSVTLNDTPNANALFATKDLQIGARETLSVTVNGGGNLGEGAYPLVAFSGTIYGDARNIIGLSIPTGGVYYRVEATGEQNADVVLLVGDAGALYWNGTTVTPGVAPAGGSGTWTAGDINWTNASGVANVSWVQGAPAIFNGPAGTVTVDTSLPASGPISVGAMTFDASSGDYLLEPAGASSSLNLVPLVQGNTDVEVDVTGQATINVPLTGLTGLRKTGTGELFLTAANSYSGTTTIEAGALTSTVASAVKGDVAITGSTATWNWEADIAPGSPLNYSGEISGAGVFNFNASHAQSTFNLLNLSSSFTGTTNLEKGTFNSNAGSGLSGTINVKSTGTLMGHGTWGDVTVENSGTFIVGTGTNDFGTVSVNSLTMADGGVLFLAVGPSDTSTSAQIQAQQDITLGKITPGVDTTHATNLQSGSRYVVGTSATGTVSVASGVSASQGFRLYGHFVVESNQLVIEYNSTRLLDAAPYECVTAVTEVNVCHVFTTIDRFDSGNRLLNALQVMEPEEFWNEAMPQLTGDAYMSANAAMVENSRYVREATGRQVRSALGGVTGGEAAALSVSNYAADPAVVTPFGVFEEDGGGLGIWMTGYGAWSQFDDSGNAASIKDSAGGFLLGVDAAIGGGMRLGALFGYGSTSFEGGDGSADGASDDYTFGLYGGGAWGNVSVGFGAAYTWHDVSFSRTLDFSTFQDVTQASYDAGTFQLYGDIGYAFDVTDNFTVQPYADASYIRQQSDAFNEQGGLAALSFQESEMDTWFTTIGVRSAWTFATGSLESTVTAAAGWRHGFGDLDPKAQAAFQIEGGAFGVTGVPLAEDQAVLSVDWQTQLQDNISFGVNYTGQFGDGYRSQTVSGRLNVRF